MKFEIPTDLQGVVMVLLGLVVGSFLNVVIVRLPRGKSIIQPSSRCGWCRSSISAFRNIPIFSFLFSAGRCSKCGYAYSGRYFILELLMPIVFFALWAQYGWGPLTFIFCAAASSFVALSFIDLEFRIIPDSLSIGGWAVCLALAALRIPEYPIAFQEALFASIAGFGFFWIVSRIYASVTGEEGLGGGDVKLMGMIGALLGYDGIVTSIFIGSLLGALIGLLVMVVRKKTRYYPIPFGPFLVLGGFFSMFKVGLFSTFWGLFS